MPTDIAFSSATALALTRSAWFASVVFRRELRLESGACLFQPGFSPCHVSQQSRQLLWTQYQQSERKYEQDFRAKTHDSPLG